MELPESYWDDINRYTGELLPGLSPDVRARSNLFILHVTERTWPAREEDVTATLRRGIYGLIGYTVTQHHLGLTKEFENMTLTRYFRFDPARQHIVRVLDEVGPSPVDTTATGYGRLFFRQTWPFAHDSRLPTELDHLFMRDELQHGADTASA